MRGYYMNELADGGYSFCDALIILFQGRIPIENEKKNVKNMKWELSLKQNKF